MNFDGAGVPTLIRNFFVDAAIDVNNHIATGGPSAFGLGAAKLISIGHIVAVLWLALLLLALLLGGLGFAIHILWWIALIVLVVWVLGFLLRAGEGGSRSRWYRWL